MKGAALRIGTHTSGNKKALRTSGTGDASKYAEAVTKLIPAEVVAAYIAGKAILQSGTPAVGSSWWIGWTIFCFLVVIGLRRWMTSDVEAGIPVEWSAVTISALSFLVWIYSFGDVFELMGWWNKTGSALILIGWTLASPLLLFGLKKWLKE